jgi:hypothetical protein
MSLAYPKGSHGPVRKDCVGTALDSRIKLGERSRECIGFVDPGIVTGAVDRDTRSLAKQVGDSEHGRVTGKTILDSSHNPDRAVQVPQRIDNSACICVSEKQVFRSWVPLAQAFVGVRSSGPRVIPSPRINLRTVIGNIHQPLRRRSHQAQTLQPARVPCRVRQSDPCAGRVAEKFDRLEAQVDAQ